LAVAKAIAGQVGLRQFRLRLRQIAFSQCISHTEIGILVLSNNNPNEKLNE